MSSGLADGLLLALFVAFATSAELGCENRAITQAHALDPKAECTTIGQANNSDKDQAVCQLPNGQSWFCSAFPPTCRVIGDIVRVPAERP